jgi:hypothetical protein
MTKPKFDAANPSLPLVRQIFLQRLAKQPDWEIFSDDNARSFADLVDLDPPHPYDTDIFSRCVLEVFWQLVNEGILVPGKNLGGMLGLPFFHRTPYGQSVLAAGDYVPHDKTGYLSRLHTRVTPVDDTVLTYLEESLETFARGNMLASTVMLGVASERVFLLVCESLLPALADPKEHDEFAKLIPLLSVKKKLDWIHNKLLQTEGGKRRAGYPDSASVMIVAIYNLIRSQRNDFGHPRETPPRPNREDAQAYLQIFPTYYATAESLRTFLKSNKV